jgi:16S rRNA C967 or C1407 C5-methylase (RsmB/RsmF family)
MMLQNLPSILVAHALNPQPRDIILDMCAAPGGKTAHLASLVDNQATIVARNGLPTTVYTSDIGAHHRI